MNKKNVVFIIIGILLMGIGVFIYLRWQINNDLTKQIERNNNLTKKIDQLQKERTMNETTDWKIYRNEEYGYEIKYPKEWFIKDSTPFKKNHIRFEEQDGNHRTVDIRIHDNSNGLSLNQWFDSLIATHCGVEKKKSVFIAGVLGIEAIYTCGEFGTRGIFLLKETQIYNIDFLLGGMEFLVNDKEKLYDQMLSAFRFTQNEE